MRPRSAPLAVLIASAALTAPPAAGPAAAAFVDVATGAVADSGRAWGTVFADFDGDGAPDLYFQNTAIAPSKVLINAGGGAFTEGRPLPIQYALAPSAGDADGDGDLDLYITSAGLANRLLRNEGSGDFIDVTLSPLDDAAQGRSAAWADPDGDGDLDLYHAVHSQGSNRLFRNDNGAGFVCATAPPLGDALHGEGVAWGDYDGDGDADLYLQNGLGDANRLFRNDGALGFADVTAPPLDGGVTSGRGAAWGDYDNDGDLDLFLANEYTDACKLLRNDGALGFADVTTPEIATATQAFGCGWADYDNDGWLDLYVATYGTSGVGAPNRLHHNQGDGSFASIALAGATDSSRTLAAAWADYDGDGDLDLYCAEYEEPNRLLRNDLGNGNHWLHVDLVGTASNSLGVGARIVLSAGAQQQLREVGGDMGYMSQGSFTAEFGLGAATSVDQLVVYWPSGIVQPVAVGGVDQRITVVEQAGSVAAPEPVTAVGDGLRLLGGAPSPFHRSTTIRFALPTGAAVRLAVHDVRGRRVAVLVREDRDGGDHAVTWNGTGADGRPVPAGVYFLHLTAGGEVSTKRVVKVR